MNNTPLPLDIAALDRMRDPLDSNPVTTEDFGKLFAQSRSALTLAARVAELERELADVRDRYEARGQYLEAAHRDVANARAHANALRDALEKLLWRTDRHFGGPNLSYHWLEQSEARAALAAHPAASLAAHDAEVLERAAKVADECGGVCANELDAHQCAEAIRALAAQAQEAPNVR